MKNTSTRFAASFAAFFFVGLLLNSNPSFANGKKIDLKPKTEKVEDPGSATPLIYKAPPKDLNFEKSAEGKLKVGVTCTDSLGMVHKKGDRSYEACIRNLDKTKPEANFNEKNPKSVGITIGK